MNKPYSAACDNNREPILNIIEPLFKECRDVLEIGSGNGQHAVYFAEKLPHLTWHCSDVEENHDDINLWLKDTALINVRLPLNLDVTQSVWPAVTVDAVFSANTAHIMSWQQVGDFFSGVGKLLPEGGLFTLYGPFNYGNQYTSESNARFDVWLKSRDPLSAIRNFEDIDRLANAACMVFKEDYEMPANNRILFWEKH